MSDTPESHMMVLAFTQLQGSIQAIQAQCSRIEEAVWSNRQAAANIERQLNGQIDELRHDLMRMQLEGQAKAGLGILKLVGLAATYWQQILLVTLTALGVVGLISPETVTSIGKTLGAAK